MRFRGWCRAHKIPQSQPVLTVGMLHLDAPELTLKAYHGRIFLSFLAMCANEALQLPQHANDEELILCLAVSRELAQWHSKLEIYGRYLQQSEADELVRLSNQFLAIYKTLALRHAQQGSLRFPLRPQLG